MKFTTLILSFLALSFCLLNINSLKVTTKNFLQADISKEQSKNLNLENEKSNEKNNLSKEDEKPAETPAAPAEGANQGNATDSGATKKEELEFGSNLVGRLAKNPIVTPPKNISSCEQMIEFEADGINITNFTEKEPRKFTMSAYFVNELDKEGKLIKSIPLHSLFDLPGPIAGAPNCISFISKTSEVIGMCLKDEEIIKSILDNYRLFTECRRGDDLSKYRNDTHTMKNTSECFGLKIPQPENMTYEQFNHFYNDALSKTINDLDAKYARENPPK